MRTSNIFVAILAIFSFVLANHVKAECLSCKTMLYGSQQGQAMAAAHNAWLQNFPPQIRQIDFAIKQLYSDGMKMQSCENPQEVLQMISQGVDTPLSQDEYGVISQIVLYYNENCVRYIRAVNGINSTLQNYNNRFGR